MTNKPLREALDDWPEPEGSFDEVLERATQDRFGQPEPTLTASEVKVLTETATRVALELGRREGLNEAADLADAFPDDVVNRDKPYNEAFIHACGCVARHIRSIASQPSGATSDATSGVPGHRGGVRGREKPTGAAQARLPSLLRVWPRHRARHVAALPGLRHG